MSVEDIDEELDLFLDWISLGSVEVSAEHQVPVHPQPDVWGVICVQWIGDAPPAEVVPTYLYTDPAGQRIGFWFLANPIERRDDERAKNLYDRVEAQIVHGTKGSALLEFPNPLRDGYAVMLKHTGDTWSLHDLKGAANSVGWRNGWNARGRRNGGKVAGMMKTNPQREARARNAEKARRALQQKTDERARLVLALHAQGLTEEQMAERLDIAPGSVVTTVARARARLENKPRTEPLPRPTSTARTTEADRLDLDALVAMAEGA